MMRDAPSPARRDDERGFAMLAVVVVLIGVGAIILLGALRGKVEDATLQQTRTMENMAVVADAVVGFAAVHNRLPCPAAPGGNGTANPPDANACATPDGIVPWRTLGLSEDQALDQWGRYLFYRAHGDLTNPAPTGPQKTLTARFMEGTTSPPLTAGFTVCRADEDTCTAANQVVGDGVTTIDRPGGAFVLISAGPAGAGAVLPSGTPVDAPQNVREVANTGAGPTFYDLPFNIRQADGSLLPPDDDAYFDDIVITMSVQQVMERAGLIRTPLPSLLSPGNFTTTENTTNNIKPQFKNAPRPDWAATEKVFMFGDGSAEPDTYNPTPDNVSKTSCAWYNEPFDLKTETLRGFARFQFVPGQMQPNEIEDTGQGFAFMLIPGTRTVGSTTCGTAHIDNAYGFKGPSRPKMALEFDIYSDRYEGAGDFSSGRNNPSPEGNHVALLNPSTQDYIGHGSTGNPQCQVWGPDSDGPAMNGEYGACTYPPGELTRRPERHRDPRPANWLEDGQYYEGAISQNAAQPYVVRFEFTRGCNADCSTCGTAGDPMVKVKAWIGCDSTVSTGTPRNCPIMPARFTDLSKSLPDTATTDYMINYCMPDRSLSYAESFDTVRLGIGFSTRNSSVALILHRLEAMSSD